MLRNAVAPRRTKLFKASKTTTGTIVDALLAARIARAELQRAGYTVQDSSFEVAHAHIVLVRWAGGGKGSVIVKLCSSLMYCFLSL